MSNSAYERYTDEQLSALAPYEPDAAVILARRVDDDLASRAYYDLATQVTQDSMPLDDWLLRRSTIERRNGVLNVEAAKLGYETALLAEAFGSELSDISRMYWDALREEGLDLTPVETSARRRVEELKGTD